MVPVLNLFRKKVFFFWGLCNYFFTESLTKAEAKRIVQNLFRLFDINQTGVIQSLQILDFLEQAGLGEDDFRLKEFFYRLHEIGGMRNTELNLRQFIALFEAVTKKKLLLSGMCVTSLQSYSKFPPPPRTDVLSKILRPWRRNFGQLGGGGGTFKIFPYREFFHINALVCVICTPSPDRRFDQSFLRKASLDAHFCLSSYRPQRLSLVPGRSSVFLGCSFWRYFAPSEGNFLVFGRLLGYALRAAHQTLASVLGEDFAVH